MISSTKAFETKPKAKSQIQSYTLPVGSTSRPDSTSVKISSPNIPANVLENRFHKRWTVIFKSFSDKAREAEAHGDSAIASKLKELGKNFYPTESAKFVRQNSINGYENTADAYNKLGMIGSALKNPPSASMLYEAECLVNQTLKS